ncbi:MAG: DUF2179 domain-containing protein [Candidatus Woesearchaeota archaeon]
MEALAMFSSPILTWVIIPLLIFLARIIDVSLGTIRVIFISKGYKFIAPALGFFEVLIWLGAIQQILLNLSNWLCYVAYAGGFAAGTFAGMYIEEKVSLSKVLVRIITRRDSRELIEALKRLNYTISTVNSDGPKGHTKIIHIIVNRTKVPRIIKIVKKFNPKAIYVIEDIRFANEDSVPPSKRKYKNVFGFYRKGK